MKFSLFENSENPEMVPKRQSPFLVLTIAVLVTGTVFIWSIRQSYKISQLQSVIYEETAKIAELRVSGESLNESSMMAVRMAATTGDLNWEKYYRESAPQFLRITEETKALANSPDEKILADQTAEAQVKGAEMENRIFVLVHSGKRQEAQLLVAGDEYQAQKKIYADNLNEFLKKIDQFQSVQVDRSNQNAIWILIAEIVLLAFFIWSWLGVIDHLRKSRKILLAQLAENKQASQARNQSEERFRSIVETTSEWIWAIDAAYRITYSNPAIEKILGYDSEDICGTDFLSLIYADDREQAAIDFGTPASEKRAWINLIHRWQHRDGHIVYLESNAVPVFDASGKLTGYRGANHDITERKEAEGALQRNVALLSSVFEATEDGIMVVDLNNAIVAYNKHFIEMWHIPEEVIALRDNQKALEYVTDQLINAEEFKRTTSRLNSQPELKSCDLLLFKDGRICERHSQPHIINGKIAGRVLSFRNITDQRRAEKALLDSQESYQQLFDSSPHPVWVYDFETLQILAVNNEAIRHYGYSREEFLLMTLKDFCVVEESSDWKSSVTGVAADQTAGTHSIGHRRKDGTIIDVEISASPITFAERPARLHLATDITARKRADAALRDSEYKLRTLLDNMNEGLSQVDTNHLIEFVNDRFCEMTGYEREDLLGKSVVDIFMDEDGRKTVEEADKKRLQGISSQYEIRLRKKSGEVLWVIIGGAPIVNAQNELIGSMGVFTDITERKLAEQRLLHDALHDGLTGLANRTLFINHLQKAIERGKRSNHLLYAVLFLDFDRFKVINDSLGHAEGDNLLKQIARRLENLLRSGDLMARLGGDEFTILLNELDDSHDAVTIAERIQKVLNQPFVLGEQEIFMTASIGIALSNAGHHRAEDMLRDADIAMYRAKAKGKAQHQIFDETMHISAINKLQLETEMHQALQRGDFSMSYQPIVNIETNTLAGFEALIRWNHPERGLISPIDFISAAEENGLVIPLGRWILYESCRQMREWQKRFAWTSGLTVSVNLSCKQFLQSDLAEQVMAALVSTQLDPCSLKLEITETHVMENSNKAVTMMNKLRSIGVGLSLDDFGTGYSSLSYLHRLPVNYLKIDRSFVSRMVESRENREIVYTIVKLAQNLRMEVIAEGIETTEQFDQLKSMGCEFGQGYFISKPMTADVTREYLKKISAPQFATVDSPVINAELNM